MKNKCEIITFKMQKKYQNSSAADFQHEKSVTESPSDFEK